MCYIHSAPHEDMKCRSHPNGCGLHIQVGMIVFVNGASCLFHKCQWYVPVNILDSDGVRTCKIGYMKVLPDDLNLICNRVGVISSIHHRTDEDVITVVGKDNTVTHQAIKRKNTKPKNDDGTNGRTLELCDSVNDYALVTFLDGGVPTYKETSNWYQEMMRRDQELLDRQRRRGGQDQDDEGSSSASSNSDSSDSDGGDGDVGGGGGIARVRSNKRGRKKRDNKPKANKRAQSVGSGSSTKKHKGRKKSRNSL